MYYNGNIYKKVREIMPRNKKQNKAEPGEGKCDIVSLRLDGISKKAWDIGVKTGNMSDWFRGQLLHHFGKGIPIDEKIQVMHEEILILQRQRDQELTGKEREWEERISAKVRQLEQAIKLVESAKIEVIKKHNI